MKTNWEDQGAFLIPALVLLVMILGAFGPSLKDLQWAQILDNGEKLFKIIGIIIGGFWAYYGFIRGRIYMPRLEPSVAGEIETIDGIEYLIVRTQLKNVGASKVPLLASSGLDIFSDQAHQRPKEESLRLDFENVPWSEQPVTFSVFSGHEWIESGETIQEERIIALRIESKALLKLELHIDTDRITTSAITIIRLRSEPHHLTANRCLFECVDRKN